MISTHIIWSRRSPECQWECTKLSLSKAPSLRLAESRAGRQGSTSVTRSQATSRSPVTRTAMHDRAVLLVTQGLNAAAHCAHHPPAG
jgi:hypothetical protein